MEPLVSVDDTCSIVAFCVLCMVYLLTHGCSKVEVGDTHYMQNIYYAIEYILFVFSKINVKYLASRRATVLIIISNLFNSKDAIIIHHHNPFRALIPFRLGTLIVLAATLLAAKQTCASEPWFISNVPLCILPKQTCSFILPVRCQKGVKRHYKIK